ncbi:MAG: 3-dehydroquinate synthase family protein [Ilumatobacter sp.]|uniref:3-dehydroquinate synthase family protein n=1 Tax=Ilumatobacter sp. TaxID=1967498 RepID=UPI0032992A86
MRRVTVPLVDRSYDVIVGNGSIAELPDLVPTSARRVAVVTQAGIPVQFREIGAYLPDHDVHVVEIGDGEAAKSLATIENLMRSFAQIGLTRNDVVVGVGGGMVTDVAGFAAASWHRGIPVVHVSTTLLGMVDAAIGGKTGVNLPEGKNLVGAFWQPSGVVCDLDALATLPPREMRCGLGEMAKYHFLTGDDLLAMALDERIARCIEIKAEVVASDEREGGRRALLNYGHTLAHALEITTGHDLAHGEAVAIGLVYAAELGCELGRIDRARVDEHTAVVAGEYDLTTRPPSGLDAAELIGLMHRDKKALDRLTFVLDGPNGVEVVPGVDEAPVRRSLERFLR